MAAIKRRILFLCTGNSARSQMAEAFLKHRASDMFDVFSAGTQPEEIDPRAITALSKLGITNSQLTSDHIDKYRGQSFDFVITLCDKANTECRNFDGAKNQLAWDFPDPKTRNCNDAFIQTLQEITDRLSMFLTIETNTDSVVTACENTLSTHEVDPIVFYKTLTDEIRLKTLMLTHYHGELCVCELMEALLEGSQPKVSRNLAVLKKANIISDRKHGQWVFYRINPKLPLWVKSVIAQTTENNIQLIQKPLIRLAKMKSRPSKYNFCN